MRHVLGLRIGPVSFRIGSRWSAPIETLGRLYSGYPAPADGICDFTIRLEPEKPWRAAVRPSVAIRGDYALPGASPLPLRLGLLAAEMGMNLQMALGHRRHLLLHAAAVEREGRALIVTGASGAGKSTLSALLGERGWRFMGDEFVLIDCETGAVHAFPRAVSLKNGAIAAMAREAPPDRFGPRLAGTPKGDIRHLRPNEGAIARMDEPASPALILFPRFDPALPAELRPVGAAEAFMRLTQASTNYVALGERGFGALTRLVRIPAVAVDYGDGDSGVAAVEQLWSGLS